MNAGFSTGQHVGDYEVISILGAGGMGKVYKVRNVISERVEAMKVLLPDLTSNQSLADRFLREIRLLATLHHPNIAALRTALTFENQLVMIIEYVEGETLANRVARAPMSTAEVVNYSDQCLAALSYAHKQNITHRDIKPANMMLTPDGIVKLMDFGIARSSVAKDGSLTSTGTTLGSLNYMPPEQVRGESADARSDIYSFGASLYEMLTGKLPFDTDSQYALMTAQLNTDPPPPITLRGDLPPALNQIIMMCMAKDPDKRFQSADALRAALKTIPVSPLPPARTTAVPASPTPATPAPAAATPAYASATTLIDKPLTPRPGTSPTPIPTQAQPPAPTPQAPQPTQSAAPPVAVGYPPAPPPQPRPSSTSRGLWLAIGSLVGVSVLLAAGIYIPRHMGTHAEPAVNTDSPSAPSVPASSTDSSASSNPSTPASGSTPSAGSDSPVSIQAPGVGVSVDDKGNVSIKAPGASVSATADGDAQVSAPGASVSATKDGSASVSAPGASVRVGRKSASRASAQAPSAQTPPSAPAAVPPANPGPSAEEVQRITDDGEKLGVRADTVNEGLNTLKQQQAASGLGLRADMVSAQQRMSLLLNKANNALQHGDTANAQKYFDQADAEISKLEKFLGH
ncbi:MAG TPA: protein kinase [Candidatus Acidoferrum sp.]|jgi:serine/threonine-protein kinase